MAWELAHRRRGADDPAEYATIDATNPWDAVVALRAEIPENHDVLSVRRVD